MFKRRINNLNRSKLLRIIKKLKNKLKESNDMNMTLRQCIEKQKAEFTCNLAEAQRQNLQMVNMKVLIDRFGPENKMDYTIKMSFPIINQKDFQLYFPVDCIVNSFKYQLQDFIHKNTTKLFDINLKGELKND